jgi:NADPH:quinone reductase-like Zn-dependent oxidoreductase
MSNNMTYPSKYSAWQQSAGTKASKNQNLTINRTYDEELPKDLQSHKLVIEIHAISLNYREMAMLTGTYPMPLERGCIPCSDAAEVVATGSAVSRFPIGDRVTPNTMIGDFEPDDDGAAVAIGVNAYGVHVVRRN